MKFLAAVLFVAYIALAQCVSDELKAKLKEVKTECVTETGIPEATITKAKAGDYSDEDSLSEFLFCVLKKIAFMNDEGEYQVVFIKEKMQEAFGEDVGALIDQCTAESYGSGKANAFHLAKCYKENAPDHHNLEDYD